MIILGISGGVDFPHEDLFKPKLMNGEVHDAAAVLIEDGHVIAAFEEERLNRIKHSGKFPLYSIEKCLEKRGIQLSAVDKIVYYCSLPQVKFEMVSNRNLFSRYSNYDPKTVFVEGLNLHFNSSFKSDDVMFVPHHHCHAASAYYMSGFDESLVVTIDGASPEGIAGMISSAEGDTFRILNQISNDDSLGGFYTEVIEFLGYSNHDEYKVMGLAPYGDPKKFRRLFKKAITLLPEGNFRVNKNWYYVLMDSLTPRMKGELFTQEHKDIAAALQETLETVVMHMLTHYQELTGYKNLCMAGGVAHNCSMNGKILYSGLFEKVFIQPASHDAGNALGGALFVSRKLKPELETEKLSHLYWGTDIHDNQGISQILKRWDRFIDFHKVEDVYGATAQLIAEGAVVGWVQDRSEFGPRALGNRSILADPRPEENKKIINEMVKKREGYRPFAPSIMKEYVSDYYIMPETEASYSYMNYVLTTKPDKRSLLGAVTHVDGTARIQTVSQDENYKFWKLIDEFRKLTGLPVLLNTSFNNNAEPIVDSEEDAIVSFLTTNIHSLVIGNYIINKKKYKHDEYMQLIPKRLMGSELTKKVGHKADGQKHTVNEIRLHFSQKYKHTVSEEVFSILEESDGLTTLKELMDQLSCTDQRKQEILDEFLELWSLRLVAFRPFESASALVY